MPAKPSCLSCTESDVAVLGGMPHRKLSATWIVETQLVLLPALPSDAACSYEGHLSTSGTNWNVVNGGPVRWR